MLGRDVIDAPQPARPRRLAARRLPPPGHRPLMRVADRRRRRVHRLAPRRSAAGARRRGGRRRQLRHRPTGQRRPPRRRTPRSRLVEHDITVGLPDAVVADRFDAVLDLASPASPLDFATMPLEILAVGSTGTRNLLDLARAHERPVLPGLDQRGVRRPARAPAAGVVLGQRQLDRPAQLLRRGQAVQRGADDGVPPHPRRRRAHRAHLQHLRRADAPRRRTGGQHVRRPGAARRADHAARRRHPDAQLLPRRRRGRRPHRRARRAPHRTGQRRQPRRVHDARAGRAGGRAHRVDERDHLRAAAGRARGRPVAAPAGHHADRVDLRLAAADRAARRAGPDDPLLRRARGRRE